MTTFTAAAVATLGNVECRDPNEPPSPLLPFEDVLELRSVVLSAGGEDAEALIAHYEEYIRLLSDHRDVNRRRVGPDER